MVWPSILKAYENFESCTIYKVGFRFTFWIKHIKISCKKMRINLFRVIRSGIIGLFGKYADHYLVKSIFDVVNLFNLVKLVHSVVSK